MLALFLLGLISGLSVGWFFYSKSRREMAQVEEDRQLLHQEQQIVFDFMHNMVEAIGEGVERESLFQRVVHGAILSTGALSACVFERTADDRFLGLVVEGLFPPQRPLPESSKVKISTRAKFIEQVLRSESFEMGEGLIGSVGKSGVGVLISDARNDPRVIQHDDPALSVRSFALAPIRFREKVLGVLAIANPDDGFSFTETDFSLITSLAEHAGLAIHNADILNLQIEKNVLELDLTLASSIQGMLLPKRFPEVPDLEVDACYQPAQKVGGDLYDVFSLGAGQIGIAIADVSGKGIPASLLMAICQSNLRHFAKKYNSPSRVLSELNRVMSEEMRKDMFVTVIYAIVDAGAGSVTIARAGHELPLIGHRDAESGIFRAQEVGSEGMALGMVPPDLFDTVIADKCIPFESGDIFLLYTDGVTEAANEEGREFSTGRLADVVKTLRERDARNLNRGILDSVKRYSRVDGQSDDITLVAVKHL